MWWTHDVKNKNISKFTKLIKFYSLNVTFNSVTELKLLMSNKETTIKRNINDWN